MSFVDTSEQVIIGVVMLLVLATLLTAMNADLTTQFTNAETQPNGTLVLAIIGLLIVGFAISILLKIFKGNDDRPPLNLGGGQFQ